MNKTFRKIILSVVFILIFVIVVVIGGNLYSVGGDDTRLYYLFPQQMLQNYVNNIVSNNTLGFNSGYGSSSYFVPFLWIVSLIKFVLPSLNSQWVLYGVNMSFGFLFFYLFLGLWRKGEKETSFDLFAKIAASLFYVFSLFVVKTLYTHQLLSMYSISVFPAMLYFFTRSVQQRKIYFSVLVAAIYSAFSSTLLSFPWYSALCFTSLPILLVLFWKDKISFIRSIFVFIIVVIFLNIYWMFHQVYPILIHQGGGTILQNVTSDTIKQSNTDLIRALTKLNPPIQPLAAYLRSSWSERYGMMFTQSYGFIYLIVILIAGAMISGVKKPSLKMLYILSVGSLLFSFLLISPVFGDWNVDVFIFFNNHIPLFTMFRNMQDKFGLAVSFYFAFALYAALVICDEMIKRKLVKIIMLVLLICITAFNAWKTPFFHETTNGISGILNTDYLNLTSYIESMHEPSRFVWLPLNFPSYSLIEDAKNPGHYYEGPSPMQFLAGNSDYTGFQGFSTVADPDLNFQMLGFIRDKKYYEIGTILQRMNAKYVIEYHFDIPKPYYDFLNTESMLDQQGTEMLNIIKGKKIQDFGTRYTLYEINPKFANDKLFRTDSFDSFPKVFTGLTYKKISPSQYDVTISDPTEILHIVFLEPFDRLWQLSGINDMGYSCPIPNLQQTMVYRYGNGWTIQFGALKKACSGAVKIDRNGSEIVSLRIIFKAQQYTEIVDKVSLLSWGVAILYLIVIFGKSLFMKKYET